RPFPFEPENISLSVSRGLGLHRERCWAGERRGPPVSRIRVLWCNLKWQPSDRSISTTGRRDLGCTFDLDEVLRLLGLSEADLSWRHPEVETPAAWGIWRQDDHGHKYLVQIVG